MTTYDDPEELPTIPQFHYDKTQKLLVSDSPDIVVKHLHVGRERAYGFRLIWGAREIHFRAYRDDSQAGTGLSVATRWTLDRVGMAEGFAIPYQFKSEKEFKTAVLLAVSALRAYSNTVIEGSTVTDVVLKPSLAKRVEGVISQ